MRSLMGLLPGVLGALVVLQAGMNRKIAEHVGLTGAVLFNGTIVAIGAILLYAWFPHPPLREAKLSWWYVLPGMMGLTLIFGGPLMIKRFGAQHTFVVLVSAQLLFSVLWDVKMEGITPSFSRLLGTGLAWIGAFLAVRG